MVFYVIVFGGWGNSRSVIRRTQGSSDLRDLPNQQVLTKDKFIAFLIQITTGAYYILTFADLSPLLIHKL